jgi:O-methyltransferase
MKKQLYKYIISILNSFGYTLIRYNDKINEYWPKPSRNHVVYYEDNEDFHSLYNKAQKSTQMESTENAYRRLRHYSLVQLFRNSLKIEGDIAECGTFHGLSAYQISSILKDIGVEKEFHIFDSFEGLSGIKDEDKSEFVQLSDTELQKQFAYGEELVRRNLKEFDFIKYYKGWIPERFFDVKDNKFSFVHVDVDLYQPIKDSIEFFYPRLNKGGIMVFDDYGYTAQFPGSKKAIDEAIKKIEPSFFYMVPGGQAYLIK